MRAATNRFDLAAVIVGHMHPDHYLDLAGLRYLYPWGEAAKNPLPVHLPPGGWVRLDALATAISERVGFFDNAYAIHEYDPTEPLQVGPLTITFTPGRHAGRSWNGCASRSRAGSGRRSPD